MTATDITYHGRMGRWEPGAPDRLRLAALELFRTQGYEETTVADLARAAGVTERTFFRHFADKREVLFDSQNLMNRLFLAAVTEAPDDAPPFEIVDRALRAVGAELFTEERHPWATERAAVIASHPGLLERESLKMTTLATELGAAFRDRGMPEPSASLLAQSAVAVFQTTFTMWVAPGETRAFDDLGREVAARLRTLVA
jgi:AcrR family transcriptional regulator